MQLRQDLTLLFLLYICDFHSLLYVMTNDWRMAEVTGAENKLVLGGGVGPRPIPFLPPPHPYLNPSLEENKIVSKQRGLYSNHFEAEG